LSESADDVRRNVEAWTRSNVEYTNDSAREAWAREEITWGVFGLPESQVGVLGDVEGKDVIELGCGTAYFSARLARRGARVVGVDPTPAQLETARRMQREFGLEFPLIEASADDVPLPDASFDLAFSEHGASTWCDPDQWISEAARLLRPRGELVFMHATPLFTLVVPDNGHPTRELRRPHFGLRRLQWPGSPGVEFQLPHGEWIRVLRASGFEIEELLELQAPEGAERHPYYTDFSPEWARKWPAEEIWKARKHA
jgi:SAM-dependent methyltransferase